MICTSLTRSFLICVSLYRCGRSDVRSPRIREGLLWAAELNMTKATRRTLRSGSWSVFRKSPNSRISNLAISSRIYYIIYLVCIYLQVHLQKLEYHEKGQYFLSLISESETHILYRFITHRLKYFKPLFLEILMIMAYR